MTTQQQRSEGCLYGLAVGDALGMPSQSLPRPAIVARWGWLLTGFEAAAADHPIAAGLAAGTVTDDTEQAVLLARHLLARGGRVEPEAWAGELAAWERAMEAKGSLELLGPSTRRAVAAVLAGEPVHESGRAGHTNGAAMRVAPVGVAVPPDDLEALVDSVAEACAVTHDTGLAIAGASAVATAVSVGVAGGSLTDALDLAVAAAGIGAGRGHWYAGADVGARIDWARRTVAAAGQDEVPDLLYRLVGTSVLTQESVPAAFGVLHRFGHDPWLACRVAASLGGDCDTVAAMVGAVAGSLAGVDAFPPDAVRTVRHVNGLDFAPLARGLLDLRETS